MKHAQSGKRGLSRMAGAVLAGLMLVMANKAIGADEMTTADFYVAVSGKDSNPGTVAAPFATLAKARDAVRGKIKAGLTKDIVVQIRGGTYQQTETLTFGPEDSGTEKFSITYRAYSNETVTLSGGREVTGWQPVTNPAVLNRLAPEVRGKVLQADLKAQGISDLAELRPRGQWLGTTKESGAAEAHTELFFESRPMTLARWPNEGFVNVTGLPDGEKGARIAFDGDRAARWAGEAEPWAFGYWAFDWGDAFLPIISIDAERRSLTIKDAGGPYGLKNGQRFYVLNLLAELDAPGEWYLDRQRDILYFLPPAPLQTGRPTVSMLSNVLVLNGCSNVTVRGLTLEVCRGDAVVIRGGANNRIAACVIRNTGNWGAVVSGGRNNGIAGCDITATGDGGIFLDGGDRSKLVAAANYADNNHVYAYSRWCRTYRPAVDATGVGNRVSHNLIHDGPHSAILLRGNDIIIEYNEVHSVCYETGDVGAFYSGRRFDWRGNIIRGNYFHDIHGPGQFGAQAVYLDDCVGGFSIIGNLFVRCPTGMFIGGGRENVVENNLFVDCQSWLHVDARGLGWFKNQLMDEMPKMLKEMPYRKPPWSTRYPTLVNVLENEPGAPKDNRIVRNVVSGNPRMDIEGAASGYLTLTNNLTGQDVRLADPARGDFRFRTGSPAFAIGFKPLELEKMGLYASEDRATWPVAHQVRR